MGLDPRLTGLELEQLRRRRSVKWTSFPPDVLPAFVAEMDFPLAEPVAEALRRAVELDDTGYSNPEASGLAAACSGFFGRRMDWEVDPAQVLTCGDVVGGIVELLRVITEPGDGVVINPPVYHPFFSIVGEAGRRLIEVPLAGGRELDLEAIERAFAGGARAIILCNPHNPTGTTATQAELVAIAAIAAEHEGWVLADEIHAPMTLQGATHVPFIGVSAEAAARGICLTSASKTFNLAGLGCAQIVTAGEPAREAAGRLPFHARHCGHLGLIASEAAFSAGDDWLDRVLAVLDRNRRELARALAERLPEVGYVPPQAGYLGWLDCSALGLGDDPAPALLEHGRIALSGGPMFGAGGAGHVRLNFGTSPELVEEAVRRIVAGSELASLASGANPE